MTITTTRVSRRRLSLALLAFGQLITSLDFTGPAGEALRVSTAEGLAKATYLLAAAALPLPGRVDPG